VGGLVVGLVGVGSTETFARGWAWMVTEIPPRVLLTGGFLVLHTTIFWPVALFFHRVDRTDRPRWVARHRIQSGRRREPPLAKTLAVLLRNQLLLLPVLLFTLGELLRLRGWQPDPTLPSLAVLTVEVVGQGVIGTLLFYASHRVLHRTWWVKRVHRVHHEFRTTSALASEYAHPVEFVVANFGALALGALLLAPSLASMALFAVIGLTTILVHHSGYALPWAPWSMPHDWHHYRFVEMFGSTGAIDRILGTSPEYVELRDGDKR
jgi:sterol desaturase/sphingolipid hydroxylase (fatty acid hydroxylase superfamily)